MTSFHAISSAAAVATLLMAACANVRMVSTEVAVTATPTEQRFGLAGVLKVPAGSPLVLATVDEKKAYCSQTPVAFNPGEGRGACFFDTNGSGYFDRWYMLGTLSSLTMEGINIPYSVTPTNSTNQSTRANRATQRVDVDWNKLSTGEGSNAATEDAIRLRDAARGLPVCAPTTVSDYCDKLNSDRIAAEAEAKQVALAREKKDAGTKLTANESAILIKADADAATARLAAQAAQAQAAVQQATYALQRQADELAYRQRLAACTAAADLVALSVKSFWGGIVAGLATGSACMQ